MAIIDFGGVKEEVVMRSEFPMEKARKVLKNETIAVIGYGVQGPGQSLNMKDNGFNVIIGQSKEFMRDWDRAVADGWKPGKDLFEIEEAAKRGTIIEMLTSDASQRLIWPTIKKQLKAGKALYFSHGFSIVYKDQTKIIPPKDVDVIMVAPKGAGHHYGATSSPGRASTPASPSSRTPRGGLKSAAWRWASPSAPATSSRPLSKTRSTATSWGSEGF